MSIRGLKKWALLLTFWVALQMRCLKATPITGDTVTGDFTATSNADIQGGTLSLGTNSATSDLGALTLYTDGTTSDVDFEASRSANVWRWWQNQHATLQLQMTLDNNNALVLYDHSSTPVAKVTLNPLGTSTFANSVTLNGTDNEMPNQTLTGANSIVTEGLGDSRYVSSSDITIGSGTYMGGTGPNLGINGGTAIGAFSFAAGGGSTANGIGSTAMGSSTTSGYYSTALGGSTANNNFSTAMGQSTASGNYSTAMGLSTANDSGCTAMGYYSTASGNGSTAMGYYSTASGNGSTAMGYYSTASGNGSTAMGYYSTASGNYSTATGWNSAASGNYSTATGSSYASSYYSTAMGESVASGQGSTAMGYGHAIGWASTAIGDITYASGDISTAMGLCSTASGNCSTAMGVYTIASAYAELTLGRYNVGGYATGGDTTWIASDPLLELGNGTDPDHPSDALVVYKNGNATLQGTLTTTTVITTAPAGDIPMFTGN